MLSQLTRYASELGIKIYRAELDVRTHYDGRGKLGMEDVSPGCDRLTYVWDIESDAPAEQIQTLLTQIDRGCHTLNSLRYPVAIEGQARLNGQELAFEQLPTESPADRPFHPRAIVGS